MAMRRRPFILGAAAAVLVRPSVVEAATVTWNPADVGAQVTLSNGNLTATCAAAAFFCARATNSFLANAKVYFECTMNAGGTGDSWAVGIGDSTVSLSAFLGSTAIPTSGYGCFPKESPATIWHNNSAQTPAAAWGPVVDGAIIGIAVDLAALKMWVTNDGTTWMAGGGGPAAGTNGLSIASDTYFPMWSGRNGAQGTANFVGPFHWTVPSGFSGAGTAVVGTLPLLGVGQ